MVREFQYIRKIKKSLTFKAREFKILLIYGSDPELVDVRSCIHATTIQLVF